MEFYISHPLSSVRIRPEVLQELADVLGVRVYVNDVERVKNVVFEPRDDDTRP